jgi:hypothetical protein
MGWKIMMSKKDLYWKGKAEIDNRMINLFSDSGWNQYMGAIWEDIFSRYSMKKKDLVVEVAPGKINKIGWGLKRYKFNGKVYIIEPDLKSLKSITAQYRKILNAEVKGVGLTLDKSPKALPGKINALVANHPLDDMVSGKLLSKKGFDKFFDVEYKDASYKRKLWNEIDKDKKKVEKAKKEVIEEWCKLIDSTHPDIVVIAQYESWFFKLNKIPQPDKHALDVLNAIKKKYSKYAVNLKNNYYIENPKRWLVLKFR